jgi:predicted metalloprotease
MNTILEDGDIDEALSAAHAVGDDAINLKCKVILFRIFYTRNLWTTQILVYEGYKTGDLNQGNSFDGDKDTTTIKIETNLLFFFYFYYN